MAGAARRRKGGFPEAGKLEARWFCPGHVSGRAGGDGMGSCAALAHLVEGRQPREVSGRSFKALLVSVERCFSCALRRHSVLAVLYIFATYKNSRKYLQMRTHR